MSVIANTSLGRTDFNGHTPGGEHCMYNFFRVQGWLKWILSICRIIINVYLPIVP